MNTLTYDNSFEGFLSAVFHYYEHRCIDTRIRAQKTSQPSFFGKTEAIPTCPKNAERVWKGLKQYGSKTGISNIFKAFLSEEEEIEDILLHFIRRTFQMKKDVHTDYSDPKILKMAKILKRVGREKHRMDAFIRFRLTKDTIYFATIAPDFNVLPLCKQHFERRYADQKWLIYDLKRKYGIYYDLETTSRIELTMDEKFNASSSSSIFFTTEELQYQELWQNYFNSTNIKSRVNMKLHVQHVPKRYWKYLSEKSPLLKN